MKVELERYTPEQWYACSKEAHLAIFRELREPWIDRINYALLARIGPTPVGYVTVKETDRESAYWQYGGALDEYKGITAVRAFQAILTDARGRYHRLTTYVKNDNVNYLHMAMRFGFRVIGIRVFKGEIFLELYQEFDHVQ